MLHGREEYDGCNNIDEMPWLAERRLVHNKDFLCRWVFWLTPLQCEEIQVKPSRFGHMGESLFCLALSSCLKRESSRRLMVGFSSKTQGVPRSRVVSCKP